ncbi:hypothetical protein P4S56_00375 [Pseudoalteromonas sp. Hal056]|uniref:hypothetical protein n=1 Tax=Pseudoalteromonas sp. Hal056 TaxID=3035159 RepID=UPI00301DDAC3
MAQVNVYRWDDEGAPQIVEGRPSEFINVLKNVWLMGMGLNQQRVGVLHMNHFQKNHHT